jgi:hypothetical protein
VYNQRTQLIKQSFFFFVGDNHINQHFPTRNITNGWCGVGGVAHGALDAGAWVDERACRAVVFQGRR